MALHHVIESHEKIAFDAHVKFYHKMLSIAGFQLAVNDWKCPEPSNLVTRPYIPIQVPITVDCADLCPLLLDRVLKSHKDSLFVYMLLNLPSKMAKKWLFSNIQVSIFP